jgi:hypothetical protein
MKSSTKDKAQGTFHEVKGKVKEKVGRATTIPTWKPKARSKNSLGRSKRNSAK